MWHVRLPFRSTYSSMVHILTTSRIGGLGREAFNHHPFCWPLMTFLRRHAQCSKNLLVGCEWRVLVYLENIFDSFHFSCQSSFGGSSTIVLVTNTAFSWGFLFISFHSISCFCPRFSTFGVLNSFFWRFYYQWPTAGTIPPLPAGNTGGWYLVRLPTNAYAKHVQRCWKRLGSSPQTKITPTPLTSTGPAGGTVWPISLHELLQRNTGRSFWVNGSKPRPNLIAYG